MNDVYTWWLVLVGVGIGVAGAWLVVGRVPSDDAGVGGTSMADPRMRAAESGWIAEVIGQRGGYAPQLLVDEILDLHDQFTDRAQG